jgi:hypothetical protein
VHEGKKSKKMCLLQPIIPGYDFLQVLFPRNQLLAYICMGGIISKHQGWFDETIATINLSKWINDFTGKGGIDRT